MAQKSDFQIDLVKARSRGLIERIAQQHGIRNVPDISYPRGVSAMEDLNLIDELYKASSGSGAMAEIMRVALDANWTIFRSIYTDNLPVDKRCRIWVQSGKKFVDLINLGGVWYDNQCNRLPHSGDFSIAPEGIILYDNDGGIYCASYGELREVSNYVCYPLAEVERARL